MRTSFLYIAAIAITVGSGWQLYATRDSLPTAKIQQQLPTIGTAPQFSLIDHNGEDFHSSKLKKTPWIANFFFSSCQHICPTINGSVKSLARSFKDTPVHFVSISVDPKRDTPDRLNSYKKKFTDSLPNWYFLSAPTDEVARIQNAFRVAGGDLPDNHTTRIMLIDKNGEVRGYYRALEELEIKRLKADLTTLLQSD